jgi:pimeloyl-ACP methyl ester carboxylesterase
MHDRPGDVAGLIGRLLAALSAQGVAGFDLGGCGLGAVLALELARAVGDRAGQVLLLDPPPLAAAMQGQARPAPDWHGGHLMAAWHEARERVLFRPWQARSGAAVREVGPGLDVASVHAAFTAIVLADESSPALADALMGLAPGIPDRDLAHCSVVLRAGDPDEATLSAALTAAGAKVRRAPYDLLADTVVAALLARG